MKKSFLAMISIVLLFSISSIKVSASSTTVETLNDFDDMSFFEELSSSLSLTGDKVIQLSIGSSSSSALTESGQVFTWGRNNYGELGDNTTVDKWIPTDITSAFPAEDKVIKLSLGGWYSSALTESGKVFTWGRNDYGQLGDNTTVDKWVPTDITSQFPADDKVIQLSQGYYHSAALTESGKVFTWGANYRGNLGDGTTVDKWVPTDITGGFPADDKVIQLSIGYDHSAVLTESGKVFTWGINWFGQLGDGTIVRKLVPTDITSQFPAEDKVIQLSLGSYHSAALTESSKVFTWGINIDGQLGDNSITDRSIPTDITSWFPAEDKVIKLSIGTTSSSALTENNKVFTWGSNNSGILGNNTTDNRRVPFDITSQFPAEDKVIKLLMGATNASAITESGKVFTWGNNWFGQLGNGTTHDKWVPTLIDSISTPTYITISFNSNGGTLVGDIEELEGEAITEPRSYPHRVYICRLV